MPTCTFLDSIMVNGRSVHHRSWNNCTYHRAFLLLWPVVLKFGPPGINFSAMVENKIQTPGTETQWNSVDTYRRFQARVKIRLILVITYKLWGSSCTVSGCMLAPASAVNNSSLFNAHYKRTCTQYRMTTLTMNADTECCHCDCSYISSYLSCAL